MHPKFTRSVVRVYLGNLAKRNRSEVFVVGFFNVALLVILLLPLMGIMMLVNADKRIQWQSPEVIAGKQSSATWSIASGDGVLELISITPAHLSKVPLQNQAPSFDCAVGAGDNAPGKFIRYMEDLECTSTIKDTAVADSRTANIVMLTDKAVDSSVPATTDPAPVVDQTIIYILLVYFIVVVLPCLVCFWNVSKIFDPAWEETARILTLRGAGKWVAATLLSAAPLAGLLASVVLSAAPLYLVSRILEKVIWEGQGFLPEDAFIGLIGAFGCGVLITIMMGVATYLRRMKLFATTA